VIHDFSKILDFQGAFEMMKVSLAAIAMTLGLAACGSDKKDTPAATPTTPVTLEQAQAIVTKSCVNANCHDKAHAGGASSDFTTITAASFKATDAKNRLTDKSMPTPNNPEGKTLSDADRTTLLNFLNGK
jgi:hypothetical protein